MIKPSDIPSYRSWLKGEHGVEVTAKTRNHFESVAFKLQADFESSPFWRTLLVSLGHYHDEYYAERNYPLFGALTAPDLLRKPFDSFFLKTFRKNILENEAYPNEPVGGWLLPTNWFNRINDIVRTTLVVRYLDGVEYLLREMVAIGADVKCDSRVSMEAREEGYYAAHFYVVMPAEIPTQDFDTQTIEAQLEIQLTTQLQDVIKKLLHKYYERRREGSVHTVELKWQWDYKSDEFVANYLGHVLHYVEGMIMEVRSRQEAASKT